MKWLKIYKNLNLPQGSGIQAGQIIAKKNVDVLITGDCGPKAYKVLQSAGIKIITNATGRVLDVISKYNKDKLSSVNGPTVEGHWI